jgi:hypothetical protein
VSFGHNLFWLFWDFHAFLVLGFPGAADAVKATNELVEKTRQNVLNAEQGKEQLFFLLFGLIFYEGTHLVGRIAQGIAATITQLALPGFGSGLIKGWELTDFLIFDFSLTCVSQPLTGFKMPFLQLGGSREHAWRTRAETWALSAVERIASEKPQELLGIKRKILVAG